MTRPSDSHFISQATMLALLAGALPAAHGATFPVSNLNDSGSGSLRAAIIAANSAPGADIVDATSQNGTINLGSPLPLLSGTLSIKGAGADKLAIKRSGTGTFRLFTTSAGASISVSGLTLSGGGGGLETGGAISNTGTFNLSGCTLSGNSARRGGAIFSTGTLNIEGSTFSNNAAIGGGAISSSNGFLNVSTSTFSGNTASGDGGALVLLQTRTSIQSSTFSFNGASSTGNGGAIFFSGRFDLSRAGLAITNSTFAGNRAGAGGALWNSGSALQLQNATITDNFAPVGSGVWSAGDANTLTFASNSIIAGNSSSASSVGDDVSTGNGKNTFVSRGYNLVGGGNSRLAFNKTGDKNGLTRNQLMLGLLASNGGPTQTLLPLSGSPAIDAIPASSLTVTVDQRGKTRPAGKAGDIGALEVEAIPASVTLVVNSTADSDDGACTSSNCTLREAVNAANATSAGGAATVTTINFDPKVFSTPQSIGVGQTPDSNLFFSTALVLTGRMKIVGPSANLLSIAGAGAVRQFLIQPLAQVSISGVTLSGGAPFRARGGAVVNAGSLELSDCVLKNNVSGGGSGGAIANDGTLSVRACTFDSNSNGAFGLDASGTGNEQRFGGGAIYNGAALSVRNSTFTSNRDSANGGGRSGGGAIFNAGTLSIENSTVASNSTTLKGGGICSHSTGTLSVSGCTLNSNAASNSDNSYFGVGGGIHAEGPLVLRNSTVASNRADFYSSNSGGGVWINAPGTIENCTITDNSSSVGGGIYVVGDFTTVAGSVIANNVQSLGAPDAGEPYGSSGIVSLGYNFIGFAPQWRFAFGDRAGYIYSAPDNPRTELYAYLSPKLGTLANNGGSVQTIAPLPDSPLINAGNPTFNSSTLPFDERGPGFPRVVGGRIDIGAFETQSVASKIKPTAKPSSKPSGGAS